MKLDCDSGGREIESAELKEDEANWKGGGALVDTVWMSSCRGSEEFEDGE